jgi:hypothetical protein
MLSTVSRAYSSEAYIRATQDVRSTNHLPSDSTAVQPTQSTPLTAEETPPRGSIEATRRRTYQEAPTAPTEPSVEVSTTLLLPQQDSGSTALEVFGSRALRRRPHAGVDAQMQRDLDTLRDLYEAASWSPGCEPIIGSPDCPILAEHYGDYGRSCYCVFVYRKADRTYGCRHERCFQDGDDRGPSFRSPAEAIRHQRKYHF